MKYTAEFCLSSLLNILGGFYRQQGERNPDFVRTLFAVATDNAVDFSDDSLPGKLYNGNANISSVIRNKFNSCYTQIGLSAFLTEASLTDDAKDKLDEKLSELIDKNEKDNTVHFEHKVCNMFFEAVQRKNIREITTSRKSLKVPISINEEGSGDEPANNGTTIHAPDSIREIIDGILSRAVSLERNGIEILSEIIRALEKAGIIIIDMKDIKRYYVSSINKDSTNDIIDDKTLKYGSKKKI